MGGILTKFNLLTKETKHVKLMCNRCKELVYIDYKKDVLTDLYCKRCIEKFYDGYICIGGTRHIIIEYE